MPSLSSYDRGTKCYEGRRVNEDIKAGKLGMAILMSEISTFNVLAKKNHKARYKPRMEFMLGNHEQRLERHIEHNAELEGVLRYPNMFGLEKFGWNVNKFLEPIIIEGISFAHYFYNPNSGRPLGGTAHTKLKNIGASFVMGHQQGLDTAHRTTNTGLKQIGVVAGSCYLHEEAYKGPQANGHWNGIVYLDNAHKGNADVRPIQLSTLKLKYGV